MRKKHNGVLGFFLRNRLPVNNFGDLLGPYIVEEILTRHGIKNVGAEIGRRLISVGSVLHFARSGDVVWGSGINGKHIEHDYSLSDLDIRSVRGPLTREQLLKAGHSVPEIYGDPGLLVSRLFRDRLISDDLPRHELTIVPNLNDFSSFKGQNHVLDPCSDMVSCIRRIAGSQLVVGSSLHGMIIAEAFGVPARLIASTHEPTFKYEDYYLGSGRLGYHAAKNISQALELGGEVLPVYDSDRLLNAFPIDLWSAHKS